MTKYFQLIILLFLGFSTQAKNYFVSKSGSDSNTGTFESPFVTLSKASSVLTAGDTCFIMAGTYREIIQPQNNGAAGKPIVYINYQNDSVLISATEKLSGWELYKNAIYKTSYKMTLGRRNMVFCNNNPMDWARWPNNSDDNKYTVEGAEVTGGSGSTIESPKIDATNWTGGYVWYLGAHSGTSWTRKITASQNGKITFEAVNINKWPFSSHNPTVWRSNEGNHRGQFFVFGKLEALDHENEWYYDEGSETVYFQAPGNANPTTLNIEVTAREHTAILSKKYIHIVGIHFFGGKTEITGTNCEIRDCYFKNCLQILDELDNTDAQVADAPVLVRAQNTLIHNNIIDGSSLNGVYIQGWNGVSYVTLSNNQIKNCNTVGIHASPIRSSASNVKMLSNTIHTTGRDGIYCGGTNCEIAWNDVYDVMRINNDGGLFYTVGNANDKNNIIHHNWFHDSWGPDYADGRCAGIYLDNNSKGYLVHHNVVWNITWTAVQINWDNWNIDIFNNSFYNVSSAMGRWENGYTIKDLVIKNNYASEGEWIGTNVSSTSNYINKISPFTSVDNQDFTPRKGSYLIDKGEIINTITDDYTGTLPDIGAYESGKTPWIPGTKNLSGDNGNPTATKIVNEASGSLIYPNPLANNNLRIILPEGGITTTVSVYNNTGILVYKNKFISSRIIIPRSSFQSTGLYLLEIKSQKTREVKKLIVQ